MWLATSMMLVVLVAVWAADRSGSLTSVRMALHTLMSPGRLMVAALSNPRAERSEAPLSLSQHEIAELKHALLENELQRRQLLIENARLHNELRSHARLAAIDAVAGGDLVDFVAVKAKVLSHTGLSQTLAETFISAGRKAGLRRSQLVVDGTGLLLDKGADHGLMAGQKVARGTAVIGRMAQVSQWVGLVQPITDKEFSAAVQIVKLAPQGASFGAKGLLEGTADGRCRVTAIAYTESVAVGDEVFSADIDGVNGPRLYYGKVVHAEFSTDGQWDILVEPAFQAENLSEVAVVTQRLNPDRVASKSEAAVGVRR